MEGVTKAKIFKEKYELKLEFLERTTDVYKRPFLSYLVPLFHKGVFMQNLKCENAFDPDNEPVGGNSFLYELFLTKIHFDTKEKPTQK